jgi:DNA repair protein RecN (Recombination protein N)
MILRVGIDNLVIVEQAEFLPGRGLTSVTGETGAGKTLLATAINLLFGGDATAAHVGAAGDDAWVEGEFEVDDDFWQHPSVEALRELRPDTSTPLVLARKVSRSGRSRAMAWGRTVARQDLQAAGALLVASAGQHAGRKLMSAAYQRELVDTAGGETHAQLLTDMAQAFEAWESARSAELQLTEQAATMRAAVDQMRDDLAMIDAVQPSEEDADELVLRRDRIRNSAALHEAIMRAHEALAADGVSAVDLLGAAASAAREAVELDASLEETAAALLELQSQASECSGMLRGHLDTVSETPDALDAIEERLSAYDELKRRFGGTVAAVRARREQLEADLAIATDMDGARDRAAATTRAAHDVATSVAARLSVARCRLADELAAHVTGSLRELGMSDSVFRIEVTEAELGRRGADTIQLMLAPSDRLTPGPVTDVASGGELSRIALALHVATGAGEAPTMIFDEIDAGIGGHTAHAIASMLARLAQHAQVICITHLPQVAARAHTHVVISKDAGTATLANLGSEDDVIDELCRMLGADPLDAGARTHALELRGVRHGIAASREHVDINARDQLTR